MIKLIELIQRRNDMTHEQFIDYWQNVYGPMAMKMLPHLRKYVQSHPLSLGGRGPAYDGMAELWFDNLDSFKKMNEWYRSDAGIPLREQHDRFASHVVGMLVEEVPIG